MHPKRRYRAMFFGGLLGLVSVLSIWPANTASGATSATSTCVFRLEPTGPADENGVTSARLVDLGCYSSDSQAFFVGSGGVRIPESLAGAALTQRTLKKYMAAAPEGDFLLGRESDNLNYLGQNVEYFASSGCASTTWQVNYVGAAWNDRFESGKGFSSCDHNRKFEHADYGGAVLLCTPNCNNYGALSNKVSSLRWKD